MSILKTDIHSHILPSLDDGADDINMSIDILRGMVSLGYQKIWTTPHISYLFPNNKETIRHSFSIIQEEIEKEGIDIELGFAAEYMFDDNFVNHLYKQEDLITLPGNHLLIEFPMFSEPVVFYKDVIFDLQLRGYNLILAHPERYLYLYNNSLSRYEELKQMGLAFQTNLLSFSGYYGKSAKKVAEKLAEKGKIDFLATDIHHPDQIELFSHKRIAKSIRGLAIKNDMLFSGFFN